MLLTDKLWVSSIPTMPQKPCDYAPTATDEEEHEMDGSLNPDRYTRPTSEHAIIGKPRQLFELQMLLKMARNGSCLSNILI